MGCHERGQACGDVPHDIIRDTVRRLRLQAQVYLVVHVIYHDEQAVGRQGDLGRKQLEPAQVSSG